ncbi:hypothetical protein HF1_05780 [Mycoplasma haemofelis str. Langford 1]|uniref:Uncharacterized protein n=1 Tax=Mycoplasma haemofelis (strain Langford 1) TaxID=941640 RepID=E8ZHG5_MYCHL|nr:hypothetical protein [Mycoplasma haemofelis]CBY92586.1 hypothetical protein HF1_05780 [Mycoplasma haemofelis str. Langford 1]
MSKVLPIGVVLTSGAGAGIGGMVWKASSSAAKLSTHETVFKTASSVDVELDDVEMVEEKEDVSSVIVTTPVQEQSPVVKSVPVQKKCEVFSVKSSAEKTVRTESEDFLKNIKDQKAKSDAEKACSDNGKVYVAKPYSDWTYRPEDQGQQWTIFVDSSRSV